MSEQRQRGMRLLAYWLFSTELVVFAALTTYIALWTRPAGATTWTIIKAGFPIWGIVGLVAIVIYVGYYFYVRQKAE